MASPAGRVRSPTCDSDDRRQEAPLADAVGTYLKFKAITKAAHAVKGFVTATKTVGHQEPRRP